MRRSAQVFEYSKPKFLAPTPQTALHLDPAQSEISMQALRPALGRRVPRHRLPTSRSLAEVSVADAHPPRYSIVSAESAVSRPSRTRSLREP